MTSGTCYGYAIDAPFDLRSLRGGGGQTLSMREAEVEGVDSVPVMEWSPDRGDTFRARLHGEGTWYRLWIEGDGWYSIDVAERRIDVPASVHELRREERLWGIPLTLHLLDRGDLPVHAAAVEVAGRAILLAAPRRLGKSTLAAALVGAGYRLLSEDISCIRPRHPASVVPGPAMLRVRQDVADQLTIPGAHPVGSTGDRVHFAIDLDRRGDSRAVPLGAIVLLRADAGSPRIERVEPARAVQELWTLSSGLPTPEGRARCFSDLVATARRVPTWRLSRPLTVGSLATAVHLVSGTVGRP